MASHTRSLMFWRDLTPLPTPMVQPTASSPHILIIGGGVTGLSNAWTLLDKGYHVTVVSKEWATYGSEQRLTSQIAGALWEYPPAVCGQHTDKISLAKSKKWCMVAYDIWRAIADQPELGKKAGVKMCPSDFYFPERIDHDSFQRGKMEEIMESGVVGFRRGTHLIQERRVDPKEGGVDAYEIQAPVIDTDTGMKFLMELVQSKGCKLVTDEITQDLIDIEDELLAQYDADVIINCTGLAGNVLAGDSSCYPIRGGLIRVVNDGKDFPKVTAGLTISADAAYDNEIVFIVPRSDNVLILGGITEAHEWDLDLTLDSPIIARMRERCEKFLPDLRNARLDPDYPLAQGLRPFRSKNIRVEREQRTNPASGRRSKVVHNYGHGGAGWSLSFGCAGDVLKLVQVALKEKVALPSPRAEQQQQKLQVPMLVHDFSSSTETLEVISDVDDDNSIAPPAQQQQQQHKLSGMQLGGVDGKKKKSSSGGGGGGSGIFSRLRRPSRKNLQVPMSMAAYSSSSETVDMMSDDGSQVLIGGGGVEIPIRLRISISTENLHAHM
ncbi:nucleotide-binding domain-containing protein [Zalerion maritima]|uniref:Nucleotide-binding domain-containing protein n=1 Tax=Zalerion maritima TaxID=339359 RepID=A0AAD5WQW6_9PEZI|nr:nucleotide-binding domain-containing protein [Zalerion maritima]